MKTEEWIDSYIKLLEADEFEEASKIKDKYLPESLFKYQNLDDFTLESIEFQYVNVSRLAKLNDPFECLLNQDIQAALKMELKSPTFKKEFEKNHHCTISDDQITQIYDSENPILKFDEIRMQMGITFGEDANTRIKKMDNFWTDNLSNFRSKMRISSFSERKDSILMWSHYADNHKGVCLEYNFSYDNYIKKFLNPVKYSDDIYDFNLHQQNTNKRKKYPR